MAINHVPPDSFDPFTAEMLAGLSPEEQAALAGDEHIAAALAETRTGDAPRVPGEPTAAEIEGAQDDPPEPAQEEPQAAAEETPEPEPVAPQPAVDLAPLSAQVTAAREAIAAAQKRWDEAADEGMTQEMRDAEVLRLAEALADAKVELKLATATATQAQAAERAAWDALVTPVLEAGLGAPEHFDAFNEVLIKTDEQLRGRMSDADIVREATRRYALAPAAALPKGFGATPAPAPSQAAPAKPEPYRTPEPPQTLRTVPAEAPNGRMGGRFAVFDAAQDQAQTTHASSDAWAAEAAVGRMTPDEFDAWART